MALQQGKLFVALYVALYPQMFVALQQGKACVIVSRTECDRG